MKAEDVVVRELVKLGAKSVQFMPNGWWSFVYNGWEMLYIPSRKGAVYDNLRICIPAFNASGRNRGDLLSGAINGLNRNIRFVKAVILDNDAICINYDHKCTGDDDLTGIVAHMLKVLSFSAEYMQSELVNDN